MKVTEDGLAMIRRFEGFRAAAYRDAVGVWTIGYGHTAMAGPPKVTPGLRITQQEAAEILARDVALFARGVADAVTASLDDGQFSALVSFAYNVGLGNFRKSSVLRAVNAGDFSAVPHRLNLWVKAGGRTLPGLVKRRAAEGAMFARTPQPKEEPPAPQPVPAPPHPAHRSNWAAVLALIITLIKRLHPSKKDQP